VAGHVGLELANVVLKNAIWTASRKKLRKVARSRENSKANNRNQ
jgi:hypothetical protein